MKELSFKIQGEFVCHLARSWFWDENREYEKCEELLLSCLMTDEISEEEKKKIVVEILEGRKILVGVNELELVEDGERIRPLADKFKEYQKKEMIRKIEEDIQRRPLAYLDPYSCDKNINEYKPVDNLVFDEALDKLYSDGWAIIRNPDPGGSVFFDYRADRRPTKRQIDTAFDHMIRFNERTLPGIKEYLENE